MARVPTEDGPQVATAPLKPQYLRPSDTSNQFGAASGRALQGVGQEISKVGARLGEVATVLQVEENERQIKKADVALSEGYRILLDGDGTPENPGYRSLRGEQALEALPTVNQRLSELRQNTIEAVPGNKAKSTFGVASEIREQQALGLAAAHSVAQQDVANEAVDIARFKSAVSSAAGAYNDPIALATHISVAESAAKSAAARKSQDPVVLEQAARAARTDGYKAAILGAVKGDDMGEAQRLFALHKDKMDDVAVNELTKTLSAGLVRERAQGAVDSIMAAGVSEQEALATVRANFSGQLEDEISSRVVTQYAQRRRAIEETEKQVISSVFGAINAPEDRSVSLNDWGKQNPEAYAVLTQNPTAYNAAVKADNARTLGQTYAPVTDSGVYSQLRDMNTDTLAETDLVPFKQSLREQDYKEMENRKDAAIKSLTATGGDKALYVSARSALNRFAPRDRSDKKVLTDAQMNTLELEMNEWIEIQRQQGVKLTEPDLARRAQALMLPLIKSSGGLLGRSDITVGAVGLAGEQPPRDRLRLRADGPVMTGEEIAVVNRVLIQTGQIPTPEMLEEAVLRRRELQADKQRRELEEQNR